jgi:cytoskeletal protein RodZ
MQPITDNNDAGRTRGQALRAERAARARRIRRRVISAALALFIAAWLMITIVLVSGHDPALASKASTVSSAPTVASTPATSTTTTASTDTPTTGTTSTDTSTTGTSASGSSGVSSVTTSQS